jgi:hypothetical protein
MKIRFVPLLALLLLGTTIPAQAQEEERGQLYEVSIMKVNPADMWDFMAVVGEVRQAAEAAALPAEYGWQIWVRDFEVGIVGPLENMGQLDDEEAWMRAFADTPGEAMLTAAFEKFQTMGAATPVSREIWEHETAWSYAPADTAMEAITSAAMLEFWIKPGMEEEFEAVAAEVGAFLNRLAGPYPVNAFRTVIGGVGKVTWATFHDGWADYYGVNSSQAAMAEAGMTEEWQAIVERFAPCITDSRSSQMEFVADASYAGPGG